MRYAAQLHLLWFIDIRAIFKCNPARVARSILHVAGKTYLVRLVAGAQPAGGSLPVRIGLQLSTAMIISSRLPGQFFSYNPYIALCT